MFIKYGIMARGI